MKKDLVSVIIPTYNRPHLLPRTLKSVLTQSHKNIEVLVIDDSTNKDVIKQNKDIIKKLKDKRISYFKNQNKKGGAGARNTGLKKAKADFIAFLDDDDVILKDKIKTQLEFLKKNKDIAIVYCDYELYNNEEKLVTTVRERNKGNIYFKLLRGFVVGETSSTLIRKQVFKKIGEFDERLPANQEYDLYIRISEYFNFDFIPKILLKKYHYDFRISADYKKKVRGLKAFYKKHEDRFKMLPKKDRISLKIKYFALLSLFSSARMCGENVIKITAWFLSPFKRFK